MVEIKARALVGHALIAPLSLLSLAIATLKPKKFSNDLSICLSSVDKSEKQPINLVKALRIAEDHRNLDHPGVDIVAIVRSINGRLKGCPTQGASTIEQQFVRTVTGRRERGLRRKLREQLLALAVARLRSKSAIADAYLCNAFYGTEYVGRQGIRRWFGEEVVDVELKAALYFVSQLKYPRPRHPSQEWELKVDRRFQMLSSRANCNEHVGSE